MSGEITTPEEVFAWTDSFTNLERGTTSFDKRTFRLDRMRRLLGLFDDPDAGLRLIHVAGTKGKGSTAALAAQVLNAAGHTTGLYTSPHVSTAFERIVVTGQEPQGDLLARIAREVRSTIERMPAGTLPGHDSPTTFELYTLLAFLYFREAGCAEAVIETGIGGRLDATNVVMPESCMITALDLEHTEILGDTIEQIAFEKAGIIKPGVPAFVAPQSPSTREVFQDVGRQRGSTVTFLEDEAEELSAAVSREGTDLRLKLRGEPRVRFRLSLLGEFQGENAALVYLTLRRTRPEITLREFEKGFLSTRLPGRMEVVGDPAVVLDGAHTPLAVQRLLSSFQRMFPGEAVLVFGSVSGKKPMEMARILAPAFRRIIISTPGSFKTSDPEEVFAIFRDLNPATELEKNPGRALARARDMAGGRLPILVTGSFYMVSEIRGLLA